MCLSNTQGSADDIGPYVNMGLDELLALPLGVGTLTKDAVERAPVSVTIITANDIAVTPARSVLDLLEVYVPGVTFVHHFNGPRLGMRGILGDQNHSFVMLVNGRNVSLKTGDGFSSEILMRDLNDIERIEIIRGPGSVTHGPGAIAGTINIVTRTAASSAGGRAGLSINGGYRYETLYGSYGYSTPDWDLYVYGSYSHSRGEQDTDFFYIDRAHGYGYGFMGWNWGERGLGTPAPHLYEDFQDKPQIKLHLDARIGDSLVVWARYSTFSQTKLLQDGHYADGFSPRGEFGETFTAWLEHETTLSPSLHIETSVGFDGVSRRNVMGGGTRTYADPLNVTESYSENELRARSLLHGQRGERFTFTVGGEAAYEFWKPEWGRGDDSFLMRFRNPIGSAVTDPESPHWQAYGESGRYSLLRDDDLTAYSFAVLGEGSLRVTDAITLMLSGRADKHELADWTYSPRAAAQVDITDRDSIKLIAQRSVRLPAFTDLYSEHEISGGEAESEVLDGFEMIYARRVTDSISLDLASFYNSIDQVAWVEPGQNDVVGNLDLWGAEATLSYSTKRLLAGLSYSYIKQLDWGSEDDLQSNLVNPDGGAMPTDNFAVNRLNNLPGQMLKVHATLRLPWRLVWHTNARLMWDYGQNDMLNMFTDAHERYGTDASREEMQAIRNTLKHYGYGQTSFTLNTQIQWTLPTTMVDARLSLYAMNLLQKDHIRYVIQYWEASRQYPRQCGFVEEPLSVGMQFDVKF
ncbi:MAG: TonB-dependent receptor plug domain-containing protein [Verrucomicrobia bacterium]|nr:TonB-dependent receptor plug domain-containing protein [Verrucomicrobiota bacterium]